MGVWDREYYREATRPAMFGSGSACAVLIAITSAIFVAQLLTLSRPDGVTAWLALDYDAVLNDWEIWRLVTYGFCHDPRSLLHILFNMLLLWCFGQELERIYGTREFYGFYLVALLASAAAHLALASATGIHAGAIGASGAVMGMLAIYWRYFPRRILLLFGVLPLEVRWVVLLYVAFDLYPVLQSLGGAQASDGVAHAAHLGGFVFGLVYHTFNLRITNWTWRPRRRPAAPSTHLPNLRVFTEPQTPDESIDSEVDRILAKISRHGEASLTEAERSALQEASRRFRIRRQ